MNNKALIFYIVISVIFAMFSYFNIDIQLNTYIEANRTDFIKQSAELITLIGDAKYSYALIILLLVYSLIAKRNCLTKKTSFALMAMFITTIITYISKFIIGRSRPNMWLNNNEYTFNPFYFDNTYDYTSMPSGHTQTSFTVAILLCLFFPKYKYVFMTIAIASGLSRVVLSAHWLGDVVIGAMFGIVIPLLLWNKYSKKL
ncbi:MAG: phosphatase PAP2 family protein [Alphaproteobacteria bacterium]